MKRIKAWLQKGKKLNRKGFTLVELIIVIVIIAVLAAIAIPSVIQYVEKANSAKALANGKNVFNAASVVAADLYSQGERDDFTETSVIGATSADTVEAEVKKLARVPGTMTIDIDEGSVDDTTFSYVEGNYTVDFNGDELVVRLTSSITTP